MLVEKSDDLNTLYKMLVSRVYINPEHSSKPRDQRTLEVLNGNFVLTNPRARIITSPTRKVNYGFAAGEFVWYWTGRQDLEYIERYNSRLKLFSDDGLNLNSAYGRRMFGVQRRDPRWYGQYYTAIRKLTADPDSRQAVIKILQTEDLERNTKDVPCTCTLQFFIRNDKLYMHAHMRSNDIFWGLPYDVFSFTMFQECMAMDLSHALDREIGLGEYYHTAGSLHIYERHFQDAQQICDEPLVRSEPMPPVSSPEALWRTCNIDPYLSWGAGIPESLQVNEGTGEAWLRDRLVEHWEKRNAK